MRHVWHRCAAWGDALVVHGGLGEAGVVSDVHVLRRVLDPRRGARSRRDRGADRREVAEGCECEWSLLRTSGMEVPRAHHQGGVVGEQLVVFSGQNKVLFIDACNLHSREPRRLLGAEQGDTTLAYG